MNVDQYFSTRSELIARILAKHPFARDWRTYAIGALCLASALGAEVWAASALADPGFFARISSFLSLMLGAGVTLLAFAFGADVLIARTAVPAREEVLEQAIAQMLTIDGSLARDFLTRQ